MGYRPTANSVYVLWRAVGANPWRLDHRADAFPLHHTCRRSGDLCNSPPPLNFAEFGAPDWHLITYINFRRCPATPHMSTILLVLASEFYLYYCHDVSSRSVKTVRPNISAKLASCINLQLYQWYFLKSITSDMHHRKTYMYINFLANAG